jgi:hypothetical protein
MRSGGVIRCYSSMNDDPHSVTDSQLISLQLITSSAEPAFENQCRNDHRLKLTSFGARVRDFLLEILATEVSSAKDQGT